MPHKHAEICTKSLFIPVNTQARAQPDPRKVFAELNLIMNFIKVTHFKVIEQSKRINVSGSHGMLPTKPDKARAVLLWEIRITMYPVF